MFLLLFPARRTAVGMSRGGDDFAHTHVLFPPPACPARWRALAGGLGHVLLGRRRVLSGGLGDVLLGMQRSLRSGYGALRRRAGVRGRRTKRDITACCQQKATGMHLWIKGRFFLAPGRTIQRLPETVVDNVVQVDDVLVESNVGSRVERDHFRQVVATNAAG
jgi:hypothetical protein